MPDEMDYDEDVRWPTDKEDNANQCALCEKTIGAQVTDRRARWVVHTQESGWASWMKVCTVCQKDRWRSMHRSYDRDEDYRLPHVIKPGHTEWQKRIFDMLGRKAVSKYEAKAEVVDASTFHMGPPCDLEDDDSEYDSEFEEAVATPVPDEMSL